VSGDHVIVLRGDPGRIRDDYLIELAMIWLREVSSLVLTNFLAVVSRCTEHARNPQPGSL